jgi:hypothetical protein
MSKESALISLLFLLVLFLQPIKCLADTTSGRLPSNNDLPSISYVSSVSAYNTGDERQTDLDPCVGASMMDLCYLAEKDVLFFAINNTPMFSWVCVESVGCGRVLDRMNSRYSNGEVDIGLSFDKKNMAKTFGRKNLKITIYERHY